MSTDPKTKEKIAQLSKEKNDLLESLATSEARVEIIQSLQQRASAVRGACVRRRERGYGVREATAVALGSDWHVGEVVEPEKVLGMNAYNLVIARMRVERFFHGIAWLVEHLSGPFKIRDLVLGLLGDLITGYLRDEDLENSECSPILAARFARSLVVSGIRYLLETTDVEKLYVIATVGNHGRTTDKKRIKTAVENSYEYLVYLFLMDDFKDEPRVEFIISKGSQVNFQIYDYWTRWIHGDEVSYNKGIGGPIVPTTRAVLRWDSVKQCAYTNMGHFHEYSSGERVIVNGSIVGYTPFSLKQSYGYTDPVQAFYLIDSTRGKCMSTPIWVASDEEPWKTEEIPNRSKK